MPVIRRRQRAREARVSLHDEDELRWRAASLWRPSQSHPYRSLAPVRPISPRYAQRLRSSNASRWPNGPPVTVARGGRVPGGDTAECLM